VIFFSHGLKSVLFNKYCIYNLLELSVFSNLLKIELSVANYGFYENIIDFEILKQPPLNLMIISALNKKHFNS